MLKYCPTGKIGTRHVRRSMWRGADDRQLIDHVTTQFVKVLYLRKCQAPTSVKSWGWLMVLAAPLSKQPSTFNKIALCAQSDCDMRSFAVAPVERTTSIGSCVELNRREVPGCSGTRGSRLALLAGDAMWLSSYVTLGVFVESLCTHPAQTFVPWNPRHRVVLLAISPHLQCCGISVRV